MNRIKDLLQSVLAFPLIKKSVRVIALTVSGVFSSCRALSVLYHLIAFIPYSREHQAVLRGKYRNLRNEALPLPTKVDLRRNIHRLEKGLLMRPRKPVFGANYIDDVINSFGVQVNARKGNPDSGDLDELLWARDVLEAYFEAVQKNSRLERLQEEFEGMKTLLGESVGDKRIPYPAGTLSNPSVAYNDLLNLSTRRKSVRWFLDKPVPRELLDKALLIARESPSACNREPYHFRIYDERRLVRCVASIPFGSAGYAENIPVIVVVTGDLGYYFSSRDRHIIYIDASLAAMGFIYALETQGLNSCVINWPDFEPLEMKLKRELGLRIEERPIMLIAVGYADPEGEVAYSQRKPLDQIRSYNRVSGAEDSQN